MRIPSIVALALMLTAFAAAQDHSPVPPAAAPAAWPTSNATLAGAIPGGTFHFSASHTLLPNATYIDSQTITLPTIPDGSYYLIGVADYNDQVDESTYTNNLLAAPIDVGVPDLIATNIDLQNTAVAGQSLSVSFGVTNLADVRCSGSWYDELTLSSNATLAGAIASWEFYGIHNLGPGAGYTESSTVTLPSVAQGNYYLIAQADDRKPTPENNKSNNLIALQVFVALVPPVTIQPASQTVTYGETAIFNAVVSNSPPLAYQWYQNHVPLAGSTNDTLALTNVQLSQAGSYTVSITNEYGGEVSQPAILTVLQAVPMLDWTNPAAIPYGTVLGTNQLSASANVPGTFAYSPPAGTVLDAGTNTLTLIFTPTDTVDYTTIPDSVSVAVAQAPLTVMASNASRTYGQPNPVFGGTMTGLVNSDNITATYNCSVLSLSPPGAYPIVPALADPNGRLGNYSVTIENGLLTVTPGPLPTFTGISPSQGLTNGGTAVTLTGSGFELGAGVLFGGQSAASVLVNSGSQITAITPPESLGVVSVVMTNPDNTTATLTNGFTYTGPPPSISGQPASISVPLGSNAVFQVPASYVGTYQWQLNGLNLVDNGRITGTHGNTLTVPGAQPADAGAYQVILGNVFGSMTSLVATLTVIVPPTITTPPQNQAVGVGGTAVFTVGVSGSGPFSYQWLKSSSPLAGATGAGLTLTNVQTTNQGPYSVVVSNAGGSTTSGSAMLTVLDYCASAQPSQAVYPMGATVPLTVQTLNCTSHAAEPNASAVVWISAGGTTRSLPATTGASGSTVVNFTPLTTEAGTYQVAAALPGQSVPAAQGTFSLVGMSLSTSQLSVPLLPGVAVTNTIVLSNLTSVELTGIAAGVAGSAPDVQVQLNPPGTLAGYATNLLTLVLTAPANAAAQDQFGIQLTTAQGTSNSIAVRATVTPTTPQLVVTPSLVSATMLQGGQTLVNFTVANMGGVTSGPIQVLLPQAPWLTTVTPQPIPPLAPGQTNQVTLALTPPANLTLGYYTGEFNLTSPGGEVLVPFQFDCVSSLQGWLQVTVDRKSTR